MGTHILISVAVAVIWFIKDWISIGKNFHPADTWMKYVGALLAGILYVFLKGWDVFQYICLVAVVVLVGHSFDDIIKFFNWLTSRFKKS